MSEKHCECHQHIEESITKLNFKPNYRYKIVGLDCANCALKVENALNKNPKIGKVSLNFNEALLLIQNDTNPDYETLRVLVEKSAQDVEDEIKIVAENQETQTDNKKAEIIRLIVGLSIFVIGMILKFSINQEFIILFLSGYLISGIKVLIKSVKNIFKGQIFDENFLMSIATIGALIVGAYEEAAAVMIFYEIGELLEAAAVNKSRKSIKDLINIKSDFVNVSRNNEIVSVKPEAVKKDELILVKPGERCALDGIVVEGTSSLDTSALTGESLPIDVESGSEVISGSLNLSGLLTIQVKKEYHDSTVSRIMDLVENASSRKSKSEAFITKFAKVYTPIVCALALLLIIVPTLIYGADTFYTYLYRGCTFLVISCPCALVISIPLSVFAGIGNASSHGALIKGGNYLELLSSIDTIVLDKTGTITKGMFGIEDCDNDETLMFAAYAESYSNHPLAKCITKAYGQDIDQSKLADYQELAGRGIKVNYNGKELLAGNQKLMEEAGIAYKERTMVGTLVYVAYDNIYVGSLLINDQIKESSYAACKALREEGIKLVMLTGDVSGVADKVAKAVGITDYYSKLLPQDKVELLERELKKAETVAFVGDGINDAPALIRSDIGISMGGIGSDIAVEASDVVLMNDDLMSISKIINISKKSNLICKENIVFALLLKVLVLISSALGISGMWLGVFADVGVALIAVVNSLRALK